MQELTFNSSMIKVLQFSDLHLGEDSELDVKTISMMQYVFQQERPDFAVFSGDLVSGFPIWSEDQRQYLWWRALSVSEEFNVPFATVFGNHDDQPYYVDPLLWNRVFFLSIALTLIAYAVAHVKRVSWRLCTIVAVLFAACAYVMTAETKSTRLSLLDYERRTFPTLSHSQSGPGNVHGASNYRLVMHTTMGPVALFFIDSGGGRIPEDIHQSQINWLNGYSHTELIPSIAFVHISPFPADLYSAECEGPKPLEKSSYVSGGSLLLDFFDQIKTSAIFVGHDHGNEWCCPYRSLLACYGKKSGYGGYALASTRPSARIIELYWNRSLHTRVAHSRSNGV